MQTRPQSACKSQNTPLMSITLSKPRSFWSNQLNYMRLMRLKLCLKDLIKSKRRCNKINEKIQREHQRVIIPSHKLLNLHLHVVKFRNHLPNSTRPKSLRLPRMSYGAKTITGYLELVKKRPMLSWKRHTRRSVWKYTLIKIMHLKQMRRSKRSTQRWLAYQIL